MNPASGGRLATSILKGRTSLPPRGEFHELSSGLSAVERRFAETVRDLVRQDTRSSRQVAKDIYVSRSMLSNLAHAKCRVAPGDDEVKALRSLYELAASNQEEQFIDWDELLRRRLALCWAPHLPTNTCVSCGAACTDCGTPDLDNPDDSDAPEPHGRLGHHRGACCAGPPWQGGPAQQRTYRRCMDSRRRCHPLRCRRRPHPAQQRAPLRLRPKPRQPKPHAPLPRAVTGKCTMPQQRSSVMREAAPNVRCSRFFSSSTRTTGARTPTPCWNALSAVAVPETYHSTNDLASVL